MELQNKDYSVFYENNNQNIEIQFKGSLRLSGMDEYEPINKLLNEAIENQPTAITLNLQNLDFLNSSGINILSKFVINVRKTGIKKMLVKGSKNIPWQKKSLTNLQRLMPDLSLELQ